MVFAGIRPVRVGDPGAIQAGDGRLATRGVGRAEQQVDLPLAHHGGGGVVVRWRDDPAGKVQAVQRAGVERRRDALEQGARRHQLGAQEAPLLEGVGAGHARVAVGAGRRRAGARGQRLRPGALALGFRDRQVQRPRRAEPGGGRPLGRRFPVERFGVGPAQLGVGRDGPGVGAARDRAFDRGPDVVRHHEGGGPARRNHDPRRGSGR